MSFGASPSDIVVVATFCRALYRKCKDAGGEYEEISQEVKNLHVVLHNLKYEVADADSVLNRDHLIWHRELAPLIIDCEYTLRHLETLISKYGKLSSANSSPINSRATWNESRFGSEEMDQLGIVRMNLIGHKSTLTLFLDKIQRQTGRESTTTLGIHDAQLDLICDKIDRIAARMGQANNGCLTISDNDADEKEVWKQFQKELIKEGFSSDVLRQNKWALQAYIREINQKGHLDDITFRPTDPLTKVGGMNPERWLDSVHSSQMDDTVPSYRSLRIGSEDRSGKEMLTREDNIKYATSIKHERGKPESQDGAAQQHLGILIPTHHRSHSEGSQQISRSRLVTPKPDDQSSDWNPSHTESSHDESDDGASLKSSWSGTNGVLIRTSDVVQSCQALVTRLPTSPEHSVRSFTSFEDEDVKRSIARESRKQVGLGSSPLQGGILTKSTAPSRYNSGLNPKPELLKDAHGNEIPPDAKWTKVNRRLVSPEILNQDGKRYEAFPDFVAILGVLSRAEIEDLAARTSALRHARHLRNPLLPSQQQAPPPPPRPSKSSTTIPKPMPIPIPIHAQRPSPSRGSPPVSTSDSDTFSSSFTSDSSSNTNSRQYPQHSAHKAPRNRVYQGSDTGVPISGYPNPYGQPAPPMSPLFSPATLKPGTFPQAGSSAPTPVVRFSTSPANGRDRKSDVDGMGVWYSHDKDASSSTTLKPRDRERTRDRDRNKDSERPKYDGRSHNHQHRKTDRDRDRDKDQERDRDGNPRDRDRDRDRVRESNRDRDRDRERDRERRNHSTSNSNGRTGSDAGRQKSSRWKENLTAAGIGGAAVSLLNVLSEAAEGI